MSFTLYNYVLSGNCYKIRLFASILGIEYETIAVDFHPGREHTKEPLLSLNPSATLPILVCADTVLTETQAMLLWLAQEYDSTGTWWPTQSSDQQALVLQWLGFSGALTGSVGQLRLHTMLNKVIDEAQTRRAAINTMRVLESHLTEQCIRGNQWLVTGDAPSIADIACFPYVALSPDAGIEHDAFPQIRLWLHRIKSIDGFITMPGIYELHERGGHEV